MCFFESKYAPYDDPPPRTGTHTAHSYHTRPTSSSSHHHRSSTTYRRSGGDVARLPPPAARRSHDYHYSSTHRTSAHSLPAGERRWVEVHEPRRSQGGVVRERERVVYRG